MAKSLLINAMQTKDAFTANGAVTHSTSGNALLDLFAVAGALRNNNEQQILNLWTKAFHENPEIALRMLLWIRDCRGGAGERRTFRVIYKDLKERYPDAAKRVMAKVPLVGRWDDLFESGVVTDAELEMILANLDNGLVCKWIPRKGEVFNRLCKMSKTPYGTFRRTVVANSKTVEQLMSKREWGAIKYAGVPSRAMSIYSKAFGKHDPKGFADFMAKVEKGEAKINASALFPYDLLRNYRQGKGRNVIDAQWKALPNYSTKEENMLVLADVSGSMLGAVHGNVAPMDVSVSLAIYISERNNGLFKDTFITFTDVPTLQVLKGSLTDRINQVQGPVGYSTNFIAAFELVLNAAVKNRVPQEEMPTKIIAISDMEFNQCGGSTNFEVVKRKYENAGYKMPIMVFWNVNGRAGNSPVKMHDLNTCLVSGASPSIIPSILGESIDPYSVMMRTLDNERYTL